MIYPVAKRAFDIAIALGLLIPAAVLCVPLVMAIRFESPGAAVFRQTRVGRGGKTFTLFKLRTMARDTGDLPSHVAGGATITRFGRLLRRTKVDELPQLVNVLSGAMSFVGPRPCLPSQEELLRERSARGLLAYRPGITGPAQLAGIDMSDPVALAAAEQAYYPHATFAGDLALMVRTILGGGSGDAATIAGRGR